MASTVRRIMYNRFAGQSSRTELAIESFFNNIEELETIARTFTPESVKDYVCSDCGSAVRCIDHNKVWVSNEDRNDVLAYRYEVRCDCKKSGYSDIDCDLICYMPIEQLRNLDLYRLVLTSPTWQKGGLK